MFTEGQVVTFVSALLTIISGGAGLIYRDGRNALVTCKADCERERARDQARIAALEAEVREMEAASRAMAKAALDALGAIGHEVRVT